MTAVVVLNVWCFKGEISVSRSIQKGFPEHYLTVLCCTQNYRLNGQRAQTVFTDTIFFVYVYCFTNSVELVYIGFCDVCLMILIGLYFVFYFILLSVVKDIFLQKIQSCKHNAILVFSMSCKKKTAIMFFGFFSIFFSTNACSWNWCHQNVKIHKLHDHCDQTDIFTHFHRFRVMYEPCECTT